MSQPANLPSVPTPVPAPTSAAGSAQETSVEEKPVAASQNISKEAQNERPENIIKTVPENTPKEEAKPLESDKIPPTALGLKILWPPADSPDADKIDVDVVAVHGIGANPATTWASGPPNSPKVNWLKDPKMLPRAIPKTRIMAFGYDSMWFGEDAVQLPLAGAADKLLNALRTKRKKRPDRPLIFICHCFGGLVVQKALLIAKLHHNRWPDLYESTTGIVFLGTPHRGTGSLTSSTLLLEAIGRARKVHSAVLNALDKESEVLTDVVNEFTSVCSDRDYALNLYCFYETRSSKVMRIIDKNRKEEEFVVDRASGTLHGHEQQGLPLDHFRLNKFFDPEDNNFEVVCDAIQNLVEASEKVMNLRKKGSTQGLVKVAVPSTPAGMPSLKRFKTAFQAPFERDPSFVGRNDILMRIDHKLEEPDQHRVALYGDSGIGKTHLAIEYAHRYTDTFPEAKVLWVSARTAEQFEQSFKYIGKLLAIPGVKDQDSNVLSLVKRHLSQEAHGQWLMVIDGVDHVYTLGIPAKPVKDYLPISRTGSVLITTCNKSLASELVKISSKQQNEDILTIFPLSNEEATSYICGRLSIVDRTAMDITSLVGALYGSPTALARATAYIQSSKISIQEYLAKFKAQAVPLLSDQKKGTELPSQNILDCAIRAFEVSFEHIQKSHSESAELLQILCIFDLQFVRRFLLNSYFSKKQTAESILTLVKFSLVSETSDGVAIFPSALVQKCVQALLVQQHQHDFISDQALGLVSQTFPSGETEQWETCDILYLTAKAVLALNHSTAGKRHDRAVLLLNVAWYLSRCQKLEDASKMCDESIKLQEENTDKDEKLLAKAKEILKSCTDALNTASLTSSNPRSPGQTLLTAAKRAGTLTKVQDCLELSKPLIDAERLGEIESMSSFALAECEDVSMLGKEHPDTIKIVDSLAITYQAQGRYAEALPLHQRVLTWCETCLGADNLDTLRQKCNVALCYNSLGRTNEAETLYRSALQSCQSNPAIGPSNPETLRILSSLASLLSLSPSHTAEAEKMFATALSTQEEVLGYYHPDTLWTMQNLAICAQNRGALAEAEDGFLEALEGQERILGGNHSATLRTLGNLALNYQMRSEREKADTCYRIALEGQIKRLGNEHPDSLHTAQMYKAFLALGNKGKNVKGKGKKEQTAEAGEKPKMAKTKKASAAGTGNTEEVDIKKVVGKKQAPVKKAAQMAE